MIIDNFKDSYLKKIGDRIGLDLPYFVKNGIWITGRYGLITLVGIIISSSFARLGTKELLGQYQYVLAFISFLSVFSLPGMNFASLKEMSKGNEGSLKRSVKYCFLSSLLAIPVIAFFAVRNIEAGNTLIGWSLVIAGILFPFFYGPNNWYVLYEGRLDFKSSTLRIVAMNISLMVLIFAALFFKLGLIWLIFMYFATNAFFNSAFFLEALRKVQDPEKNYLDLKYGLYCTLQKFTGTLFENLQVLAVSFLYGFETLAIFQIAHFFISSLVGFSGNLASLYTPLLFKYKKLNYYKIIFQKLFIGFTFFIIFIIVLKLSFFILYGESYRESYELAKIFSFVAVIIPLRVFLVNFLTTSNKNNVIIATNLISNATALLVLYGLKNTGFTASMPFYFYSLNLISLAIPLFYYLSVASKKRDSILSEIKS